MLTASDDADGDGVIDESEYAIAKKRIEVEEKEKAIESSRASESQASESRASASQESESRASEQAEWERQQQQQQQEPTQRPQQYQWPSPPYQPGQGMEWFTKGPFQSEWTCDQNASAWPSGASECFEGPDGNAYYYAIRQAAR